LTHGDHDSIVNQTEWAVWAVAQIRADELAAYCIAVAAHPAASEAARSAAARLLPQARLIAEIQPQMVEFHRLNREVANVTSHPK